MTMVRGNNNNEDVIVQVDEHRYPQHNVVNEKQSFVPGAKEIKMIIMQGRLGEVR